MSAPIVRTASGVRPLTVACVPTGRNAGVATLPCGVVISTRRAAPSVASKWKEKASGMLVWVFAGHLGPKQQARVAVGVESIVLVDRVRVGALHRREPAKRRNQHEQRGARQVEIAQHHFD